MIGTDIQLSSAGCRECHIAVQSTYELDRQGVLVLRADTLRDPQNDGREHQRDILGHIGVSIVRVLLGVVVEDGLREPSRQRRRVSQNRVDLRVQWCTGASKA